MCDYQGIKVIPTPPLPSNSFRNPQTFLPAATKLGQGNIFIGVCQEFCSQGGGWWSGPGEGGSEIWGGCLKISRGGVSNFSGGECLQIFFSFFFNFFSLKKFLLECTPPPPRQSMRGRYASYWNAFLCDIMLTSVAYATHQVRLFA